jgi:hypothetical protein
MLEQNWIPLKASFVTHGICGFTHNVNFLEDITVVHWNTDRYREGAEMAINESQMISSNIFLCLKIQLRTPCQLSSTFQTPIHTL